MDKGFLLLSLCVFHNSFREVEHQSPDPLVQVRVVNLFLELVFPPSLFLSLYPMPQFPGIIFPDKRKESFVQAPLLREPRLRCSGFFRQISFGLDFSCS